jgi:hypothetical protein
MIGHSDPGSSNHVTSSGIACFRSLWKSEICQLRVSHLDRVKLQSRILLLRRCLHTAQVWHLSVLLSQLPCILSTDGDKLSRTRPNAQKTFTRQTLCSEFWSAVLLEPSLYTARWGPGGRKSLVDQAQYFYYNILYTKT